MQIPDIDRQKAKEPMEPMQQKPISDPALSGPADRMRPIPPSPKPGDRRFAEYLEPGSERNTHRPAHDTRPGRGGNPKESPLGRDVSAADRRDGSSDLSRFAGRDAEFSRSDTEWRSGEEDQPATVSAQLPAGAEGKELPDDWAGFTLLDGQVRQVGHSALSVQTEPTGGMAAGRDKGNPAISPDAQSGAIPIVSQFAGSQGVTATELDGSSRYLAANGRHFGGTNSGDTMDADQTAGTRAAQALVRKNGPEAMPIGHLPDVSRTSSDVLPEELHDAVGVATGGESQRVAGSGTTGTTAMATELATEVLAAPHAGGRRGSGEPPVAAVEMMPDISLPEKPLPGLQHGVDQPGGETETAREPGIARDSARAVASMPSGVRSDEVRDSGSAMATVASDLEASIHRISGRSVFGQSTKSDGPPDRADSDTLVEEINGRTPRQNARDAPETSGAQSSRNADTVSTAPSGNATRTEALPGFIDWPSPGMDAPSGFDALSESDFGGLELGEAFARDGAAQVTLRPTAGTHPLRMERGGVRSVAGFLAERAIATGHGDIELRLSPKELGNLRISFSSGDSNLTVTIQADRPETLEMFRRNIAQFTQDLAEMGYENVSMSFAEQGGGGTDLSRETHYTETAGLADDIAPEGEIDASPVEISNVASGLDLRL